MEDYLQAALLYLSIFGTMIATPVLYVVYTLERQRRRQQLEQQGALQTLLSQDAQAGTEPERPEV